MLTTFAKKRSSRPPLFSVRNKSHSLRKLKSMREQNPNVKVGSVEMECELHQVIIRTLYSFFCKSGLKYIRLWKQGILTPKDKRRRVAYALKALKNTTPMFCKDNVLLHLDTVSFFH